MSTFDRLNIHKGNAICYSGYRDGQSPDGEIPTYAQVKEDLLLLNEHWAYLRLFDCDEHSKTIFEVIKNEGLNFKVMLGAYIVAEQNNFDCPWDGGVYPLPQLKKNRLINQEKIDQLIEYANTYSDIIFSVSVGNEACVSWTDHFVPEVRVMDFVKKVQSNTDKPVTFCENYVPWIENLNDLAATVDFISIHTYPVWEYKNIDEALAYTKENYYAVADKYPNTPVVITEAGWTTRSNGKGIEPSNVSEQYQKTYFDQFRKWINKNNILAFYFEAFDENWKGSPDPLEPEKHWGIFKADRSPKLAAQILYE